MAKLGYVLYLSIGIASETVECNDYGQTVFCNVFYMRLKIDGSLCKSIKILFGKLVLRYSSVIFERTDSRYDNDGRRSKTCLSAFYIKELFSSEIRTEACFGYRIVGKLERELRSSDGVTSVSNVCKRPAVDKRGGMLKRLNGLIASFIRAAIAP